MTKKKCLIFGCDRPYYGRGWCNAHYRRWKRYGDPTAGGRLLRPKGLTEAEAFSWFMQGEPPKDGCWDWPACTDVSGYGRFVMDGIPVLAHVASYRKFWGDTNGLNVLHDCDRPICCHPKHLHLGTQLDNAREAIERGLMPNGERNGHVKLTDAEVLWIREQVGVTHKVMAERFGVSRQHIGAIRQGLWRKELTRRGSRSERPSSS